MTVDFVDLNGDGLDDFIVCDMLSRSHYLRNRQFKPTSPSPAISREADADRPQVGRNFLQLSRGDGTYADIAHYAGVAASDWTWSVAFMDVDLDGVPDILVTTGYIFDPTDLDGDERTKGLFRGKQLQRIDNGRSVFPPLTVANRAFHNNGNLTFSEVGKEWGFDSKQTSYGMALADLDNDGSPMLWSTVLMVQRWCIEITARLLASLSN